MVHYGQCSGRQIDRFEIENILIKLVSKCVMGAIYCTRLEYVNKYYTGNYIFIICTNILKKMCLVSEAFCDWLLSFRAHRTLKETLVAEAILLVLPLFLQL